MMRGFIRRVPPASGEPPRRRQRMTVGWMTERRPTAGGAIPRRSSADAIARSVHVPRPGCGGRRRPQVAGKRPRSPATPPGWPRRGRRRCARRRRRPRAGFPFAAAARSHSCPTRASNSASSAWKPSLGSVPCRRSRSISAAARSSSYASRRSGTAFTSSSRRTSRWRSSSQLGIPRAESTLPSHSTSRRRCAPPRRAARESQAPSLCPKRRPRSPKRAS